MAFPNSREIPMKKSKNLADSFDICKFIETHYGVGNMLASNMTSYISPEYEVKTRDVSVNGIQNEIDMYPEEETAYPKWPASPNQVLLAFMKHHGVTEVTLTQ
jgi:hypothetical protein